MVNFEHLAGRPFWDCRDCGQPWPCTEAKKQLLATLSPTQLSIHGMSRLEVAARDLPTMTISDAFERFVSWTWPENAAAYEAPPE